MTLPRTTQDIGEQLSRVHRAEKEQARDTLLLIMSSIRFLARQGLALRGDHSDESANLVQLLHLRAEDKPQLLKWLEKSAQKHTSPENQNEMLELMAHGVLRKVLHESPFLAVMVDETTDKSNKEQLTFVIRWVNNDFIVSEDFLGLYSLSAIDAQSIMQAMKDVFLRFQIPFAKLRGQCYDGCNIMAGTRAGVATEVQEIEPRAVFTHCYGHALNLGVSDAIKKSPAMKDCLDTCIELVKLRN